MFAVTIDQRSSRSVGDRVPELLELLAEACAGNPPIAGFDRTVGDEVEGLFDDAAGVVAAVRAALAMGDWHIGLGIGSVESVGRNVREARGSAFVAAREAVERAKISGEVEVRQGADVNISPLALEASQVLFQLLGALLADRTDAQREVSDLFDAGLTGREAAAALGVSPSAVSQRRTASRYDLETRGWAVLNELLGRIGDEVDARLDVEQKAKTKGKSHARLDAERGVAKDGRAVAKGNESSDAGALERSTAGKSLAAREQGPADGAAPAGGAVPAAGKEVPAHAIPAAREQAPAARTASAVPEKVPASGRKQGGSRS